MKTNFILLSVCFLMTSCVMNEEIPEATNLLVAENKNPVHYSHTHETIEKHAISDDAFSHIKLNIRNEMSDLYLIVEGIRICNIHLSGTYHFPTNHSRGYWETDTTRTNLTIETELIELAPHNDFLYPQTGTLNIIPQSMRAWIPAVLPQESSQSYLLLNCKIYQIHNTDKGYQAGKEVMIWGNEKGNSAEVAIPLSIHFQCNQEHCINIELSTNCPWYNINGSQPTPILVPITFDVSVEDWKDV